MDSMAKCLMDKLLGLSVNNQFFLFIQESAITRQNCLKQKNLVRKKEQFSVNMNAFSIVLNSYSSYRLK